MNGLPSHMTLLIDLIQQFALLIDLIHRSSMATNRGRALDLRNQLSQGNSNTSNICHGLPSLGNSR